MKEGGKGGSKARGEREGWREEGGGKRREMGRGEGKEGIMKKNCTVKTKLDSHVSLKAENIEF